MMKIIKSKIFIGIIILIAVIGGYLVFKPKPKPEYTTEKVTKGNLEQTVSVTGSVQGAKEINLNFETIGTLARLEVKKGESVAAGKTLAQLSAQSQQNSVYEAQANYQAAAAQLDKLVAGASQTEINVSAENVKNAEISYNNKINDLANLELKLASDKSQYESNIVSSQTSLVNSRDNALNTTGNELFDGETALNRIYDILERDDAQYTLGTKNIATKTTAENSRLLAVTNISNAKQKVGSAKLSLTDQDIISALDSSISSLLDVSGSLSDIYEVLVNTPASTDYTQTEIDTDKTNVRADQTNISASISAIQSVKTAWDSAKANLTTAQNNLSTFLASKDSQIASAQGAILSAKGTWDLTKAQYDQLLSPARIEDIDLQRARVSQARAALQRAQVGLDQMTIVAPVSGTITRVNYEVGEKNDLSKPVFSLLGDSGLEIEVDIPESDIAKIQVGQKTHITLDAFDSDQIFEGHVTFIDPAETIIQDVVYYRVKITFDQGSEIIKPGMTANIDILADSKENILIISARAVKENGDKYVEVLNVNQEVVKKIVETGLRGDGGMIEIISGVTEGEEIITFKKEVK